MDTGTASGEAASPLSSGRTRPFYDPRVTIPESARRTLVQRLEQHRRARWSQLERLDVRFRTSFAYVDGVTGDDDRIPLCRLRWGGAAARWGFAIWLASRDRYEDAVLPSGAFTGSPEDALDCACGLYLHDPSAWI